MGIKFLCRTKPHGAVLNPKKNGPEGKNIVVSVTTLKRLSFGPCSTRSEQGPNSISTKANGFGEPKKGPEFSA
jgi:hypothetical protein